MKMKILIVVAVVNAATFADQTLDLATATFLKKERMGAGVWVTEVPRYECYGAYFDYLENKFVVDNTQKIDCGELQKLAFQKFEKEQKNAKK